MTRAPRHRLDPAEDMTAWLASLNTASGAVDATADPFADEGES